MLQTSGKVTPFLWFESQAEVDRYWETLVADGGSPSQFGRLEGRFGLL